MDGIEDDDDYAPPRHNRLAIGLVIVLIHVAIIYGLIRTFTPDLPAQIARQVVAAFDVTVETKEADPPPPPAPEPAGAAAPPGKKATPKEETAPEPKVNIARKEAPKVAAKGNDNSAGAAAAGSGTGAGGTGQGTGAGGSGSGTGGGAATKAVKIAGDINSARDYPKATRDLRSGDHVVVALTVGADGSVKGCRIHRKSRDAEADRITCALATQRFRFKPATDAAGNPVQSTYGWQQKWWDPRD